ncbi:MAG: hypothetical protein ACE145_08675 [Terriglobia bacterium]
MADFSQEKELLKLAIQNTEQLKEVVEAVESKLALHPSEAQEMLRPCGALVQRLIESQGLVEELIEKIYAARRV